MIWQHNWSRQTYHETLYWADETKQSHLRLNIIETRRRNFISISKSVSNRNRCYNFSARYKLFTRFQTSKIREKLKNKSVSSRIIFICFPHVLVLLAGWPKFGRGLIPNVPSLGHGTHRVVVSSWTPAIWPWWTFTSEQSLKFLLAYFVPPTCSLK